MKITSTIDRTSSLGVLVAALSCAGCFPALGSFGAAVGLGFLSAYEGFLFRELVPALALLALIANGVAWYRHRVALRGLLSIGGPLAVLAALLLFWSHDWSIGLFYAGLASMLIVSVLDIFRPARTPPCRV